MFSIFLLKPAALLATHQRSRLRGPNFDFVGHFTIQQRTYLYSGQASWGVGARWTGGAECMEFDALIRRMDADGKSPSCWVGYKRRKGWR